MVIDDVFAVIAEGTRREILGSLRSGDKAVGELVEELAVSQPTVSKHLKVLREAGLVAMRAQGQKRFYSLRPEPLQKVVDWLVGFESTTPGGVGTDEGRGAADHGGNKASDAVGSADSSGNIVGPSIAPDQTADVTVGVTEQVVIFDGDERKPQHLQRTMGRAAGRAADIFANLPRLRRRKE